MEWQSIVKTVAPWIGTALGGPLGGMAVSAISDALGLSEKTESSIKQALSGVTPDQMLALKKADQDFALRMQELGFENQKALEQLAVSDRDSARKREIEVRDTTPRNMAYAITIGFFGVLYFMLVRQVPDSSRDILNIMLGVLGTAWTGVISYYYGSTSHSMAKTELLAKAATNASEK